MLARSSKHVAAIAAGVALVLGAGVANADESPGKKLFTQYCGSCHGPDGRGDGVLSGVLKEKPADLTLIAKNNGGEFPRQKVMRFIDGTTDVRAHGNPDMPVWGEVFKEQLADSPTQQAEIRTTILEITNYIATIQQK